MTDEHSLCPTPERFLEDLRSDDEAVVVKALHAACPCTGSSDLYVQHRPILDEMKKDPRPKVRAVALHLTEDAISQLMLEDERANGFDRNKPGGYGKRGTPRRHDRRQGFAEPTKPGKRRVR